MSNLLYKLGVAGNNSHVNDTDTDTYYDIFARYAAFDSEGVQIRQNSHISGTDLGDGTRTATIEGITAPGTYYFEGKIDFSKALEQKTIITLNAQDGVKGTLQVFASPLDKNYWILTADNNYRYYKATDGQWVILPWMVKNTIIRDDDNGKAIDSINSELTLFTDGIANGKSALKITSSELTAETVKDDDNYALHSATLLDNDGWTSLEQLKIKNAAITDAGTFLTINKPISTGAANSAALGVVDNLHNGLFFFNSLEGKNDFGFITFVEEKDPGYLIIGTGDDGIEPIYVGQFITTAAGVSTKIDTANHKITLLDENGYSVFNKITSPSFLLNGCIYDYDYNNGTFKGLKLEKDNSGKSSVIAVNSSGDLLLQSANRQILIDPSTYAKWGASFAAPTAGTSVTYNIASEEWVKNTSKSLTITGPSGAYITYNPFVTGSSLSISSSTGITITGPSGSDTEKTLTIGLAAATTNQIGGIQFAAPPSGNIPSVTGNIYTAEKSNGVASFYFNANDFIKNCSWSASISSEKNPSSTGPSVEATTSTAGTIPEISLTFKDVLGPTGPVGSGFNSASVTVATSDGGVPSATVLASDSTLAFTLYNIQGPQGGAGPIGPTGPGFTGAAATISTNDTQKPSVLVTPSEGTLNFAFYNIVGPTGPSGESSSGPASAEIPLYTGDDYVKIVSVEGKLAVGLSITQSNGILTITDQPGDGTKAYMFGEIPLYTGDGYAKIVKDSNGSYRTNLRISWDGETLDISEE